MPQAVAGTDDEQSVRMQRMLLILKKALDVSVHGAAAVNLRACVEAECRGDAGLLAQFFPDKADAEELGAQAVLSLRGRMETVFEWLCEKHDVNQQLAGLEQLILEAEETKLRKLAARKEEAEKQRERELQRKREEEENGVAFEGLAPEKLVRAERLRVLEEEKQQLEALAAELAERNEQLRATVEAKRASAAADVERLQLVSAQLDQVSSLAKDYASRP